jgi:N-formylmaleamate deformylase
MLPHWTQNDLMINANRLHYYRTGRGDKRPLVMVHGFSDNGLCWTPAARALESEYDVIMPDMAADLAGLIRALGLNRPVVVGHSMGAMVAYQTGMRFPELAGALVLEDPPWWLSRPDQAPHSEQIAQWAKNLRHRTLEELLAQCRAEHPHWPEELVRHMSESKKQLDPAFVDTMTERMHSPEWDWETTVQNVAQPVLIFTGNPALGAIVTPEVIAKIRERKPGWIIAGIPDVGHLIRFDNFDAYMGILRAFLNRIAQEP